MTGSNRQLLPGESQRARAPSSARQNARHASHLAPPIGGDVMMLVIAIPSP